MNGPEADRRELEAVALSIARGDVVDWHRAGGGATSPRLLEAMRVIDKVATLAAPIPDTWGRVAIKGELGAGAHGIVYAAHDPHLGIDIALKVIRSRGLDSITGREAALNEGRLLAQVTHPNVVRVFWAEAVGEEVGVAMELLRGQVVSDMINHRGPLDYKEAVQLAIDVCRAIGAVHAADLLHGDIKAGNVMRTREGRTVLMDFGVGHDLKAQPAQPFQLAGTPLYLAPEVFAGHSLSRQSDIYSVGVLLYYLVTGTYPIEAKDAADIERHHASGRPCVPLRERRAGLPRSLAAVVQRAISRCPEDRYSNAREFEAALAGLLGRPSLPMPLLIGTAAAVVAGLMALSTSRERVDVQPAAPSATSGAARGAEPAPTPVAGTYRIEAAFYRHHEGADTRLAPGARVAIGDELSLRVTVSRPVYAYVVNEDDRGASYLLFPLPGQQLRNPLAADVRHEMPGVVDGEHLRWKVNSAGGLEHFVIVVSPEPPAPRLARLFASLPQPALGAPLLSHQLSPDETVSLRGVGGLVARQLDPRRRLSEEFTNPLAEREEMASGVWARHFTLENPEK